MTVVTPLQSISVDLSVTNLLQVGLYGFLVVLYYYMYKSQKKQTEIQDRQTTIMESQNRLMAAEHQPEIKADGDLDAVGNSARITLSNVGEGRARKLGIQCYPFFKNNKGYWIPFSMHVLDFVIGPVKSPLSRAPRTAKVDVAGVHDPVHIETGSDPSPLENGLEAKEDSIRFEGQLKQEIASRGPSMTVDFTGAINQMIEEWGADEISIDIYVTYADIIDEEHSRHITSRKGIEVEQGMNFEEALKRGKKRDKPVETLVPDSEEEKLEGWS
ncbi:hypothetical protein [Natrinema versiforme]|uniref:Uncharacterized protein n=1 Tax=Natrinema versiforme TaxID=88724 RepID=A0A4P8WLA8_9EURY|nr:hypothetical protein [Natrinema versiforme]QCS43902.1 hypothetical protein FEJ81_16680 [Natrinema versiforme]